jgi:hypothetical protein
LAIRPSRGVGLHFAAAHSVAVSVTGTPSHPRASRAVITMMTGGVKKFEKHDDLSDLNAVPPHPVHPTNPLKDTVSHSESSSGSTTV